MMEYMCFDFNVFDQDTKVHSQRELLRELSEGDVDIIHEFVMILKLHVQTNGVIRVRTTKYVFPPEHEGKWRPSEHALASCTGLSLLPPHPMQGGVRGRSGTMRGQTHTKLTSI